MAVSEQMPQVHPAGKTVTAFEVVYFDVQAELGFTKHPGALEATNELIDIAWTQPKYRQFVKEALSEPMKLVRYWGYGVYVGKK